MLFYNNFLIGEIDIKKYYKNNASLSCYANNSYYDVM